MEPGEDLAAAVAREKAVGVDGGGLVGGCGFCFRAGLGESGVYCGEGDHRLAGAQWGRGISGQGPELDETFTEPERRGRRGLALDERVQELVQEGGIEEAARGEDGERLRGYEVALSEGGDPAGG